MTARLERAWIQRYLSTLTALQRESVMLALAGGRGCPEVAAQLDQPTRL